MTAIARGLGVALFYGEWLRHRRRVGAAPRVVGAWRRALGVVGA